MRPYLTTVDDDVMLFFVHDTGQASQRYISICQDIGDKMRTCNKIIPNSTEPKLLVTESNQWISRRALATNPCPRRENLSVS